MDMQVVVVGYGAIGRAVTALLTAQGRSVRVIQRTEPASLPHGASFHRADVLDGDQMLSAAKGAAHIVNAVGLAYSGAVWRDAWPRLTTNLVEAGEATGARIVFLDNLYMYGPQDTPLREDMPLKDLGQKPRARSEATRIWMAASQAGRVKMTALRAADFYGPGVAASQLGFAAFGALAQGKPANLLLPPDVPHDFAYVPDLARAIATLMDAPEDVCGQVWHAPCAPTRTPREILALGAAAIGQPLKLNAVPGALVPTLGLVSPMLREFSEMRDFYNRPYRVDWSKFASRFWSDPTPFELGAGATARSFVSPSLPVA